LNLAPIVIESHVCISQRAFLYTGNHNYKSPVFDLIVKPIHIEQSAWIGAGALSVLVSRLFARGFDGRISGNDRFAGVRHLSRQSGGEGERTRHRKLKSSPVK